MTYTLKSIILSFAVLTVTGLANTYAQVTLITDMPLQINATQVGH
tara:strand:- start:149182 stop:149316 length:135 start_codon:yes stop_codon:yes gene_type:complete